MEEHRQEFEIGCMCRVLEVSRSGYYGWRKRAPSQKALRDRHLKARIIDSHANSDSTYGTPRVKKDLVAEGETVSRRRIGRIMKENELYSRHSPKTRVTTKSDPRLPVAENVLDRDFTAEAKDRKWVTDITYIYTAEGWLYLAVVLDLYSRRVVGWAMAARIDTELVLQALRMALANRKPVSELLHHSDRGSQYASNEYRELLETERMLASMSRKANCWDNAVMESFFKTLKVERVNHRRYRSRLEAQADIFQYIEVFYNRKRRHSAIGYVSPVDFETLRIAA